MASYGDLCLQVGLQTHQAIVKAIVMININPTKPSDTCSYTVPTQQILEYPLCAASCISVNVKNTMYRFRPQSTWWSAKGYTFQAYPFTQVITRRRYVFLMLTPLNLKVPTIMTVCGGMTQGCSSALNKR